MNNKLKVFVVVSLIFSLIYFFLILKNKVPFAHDTFQYLQQQYVYFNEVVQNHSIPVWFPFMSCGNVGNYYFTPQLTILSPIFYLLGLFIKDINYLYLFYFALFFEEIFFLLGIVLLSSLYYKETKTIFFVSITLLGTTIWYPQIWWNFHLFYFLPIVLYCIHRYFLTKLFRYFIFSIIFFTLTVHGNFIYCIVFSSFVIFIYTLFLIPVYFDEIRLFFHKKIKLKYIIFLLILLSIIAMSFYYIKYGDEEIAYVGGARGGSNKIDVNTFLTYGGSIGLGKYEEIFGKYGGSADINLYAGYLLIPFVLISLFYVRDKVSFVVGSTALIIFLFSIGTFVSLFFYYVFPFGNMFRHIGLTATVFKLFIVFYAGFGFEIFLNRMDTDKKIYYFMIAFLLVLVFLLPLIVNKDYLWNISKTEKTSLSLLISILLIINIFLFYLMARTRIKKEILLNLLLIIIAIDLFSYKYSLIVMRMPSVSKDAINLFKPYKYNFQEKRLNIDDNNRVKIFKSVNFIGARYNTIDSFLFIDLPVSPFRTDFLLKPSKEYFYIKDRFPNDKVYKKYSGVNFSKLGVFSCLNVMNDEFAIGNTFNLKEWTGDMLFTTKEDIKDIKNSIYPDLMQQQNNSDFKNQNERIDAKIQIEKFSFNMLKLKVTADGPPDKYCFLYYSSTYNPHWNVYVNGKKTPVIKSNIGYKSIMIPYGTSEIIFKFGNTVHYTSIFCSILVLVILLNITIYIFIKEIL